MVYIIGPEVILLHRLVPGGHVASINTLQRDVHLENQ